MLVTTSLVVVFWIGYFAARSKARLLAEKQWDSSLPDVMNRMTRINMECASQVLALKLRSSDLTAEEMEGIYKEASSGMFNSQGLDQPHEYRDIDSCINVIKEKLIESAEAEK